MLHPQVFSKLRYASCNSWARFTPMCSYRRYAPYFNISIHRYAPYFKISIHRYAHSYDVISSAICSTIEKALYQFALLQICSIPGMIHSLIYLVSICFTLKDFISRYAPAPSRSCPVICSTTTRAIQLRYAPVFQSQSIPISHILQL